MAKRQTAAQKAAIMLGRRGGKKRVAALTQEQINAEMERVREGQRRKRAERALAKAS